MIPRYTTKEMGAVWSEENKFKKWLEIEKAVATAQADLGIIPGKAADDITKNAKFEVSKINEIEQKTNHDVIAFLTNVSSHIGQSSRYLHYGLTSSDIGDSSLSLQMLEAMEIIEKKSKKLLDILKSQSKKYSHTVMVGRTHGIHAEPITLGLKFSIYAFEMARNLERLKQARENIRCCWYLCQHFTRSRGESLRYPGIKTITCLYPDPAERQACAVDLSSGNLRCDS